MNRGNQEFDQLYKLLNPAQKQAVDTIDGPVMVIAGPGTGKTSILTLRIANILKQTDTQPENILALTFTESGAYNVRKKLVSIIGSAGYKVNIHTFHSFAQEIIQQYPERFPRIIGSTPANDIDFLRIVEQAVNEVSSVTGSDSENQENQPLLRPTNDPVYYVKPILHEIKNLKREGYTPADFQKSIDQEEKNLENSPDAYHTKGPHKGKKKQEYIKHEERIAKNRELAKVFSVYERILTKEKLYDFEDMILELVRAMREDNELLLILQEEYQYILADEHQDANNSQNSILELLSDFHDNPNLFIVGDEKQAIYRFQGASLQNFLYFQRKYPKALLINLEHNYRSKQDILDATHSLIENNPLPDSMERVKLVSGVDHNRSKKEEKKKKEKDKKPSIHIHEFPTYTQECIKIADLVHELIDDDANPEEIAILYRENSEAYDIAEALASKNIPYRIESESDLIHHRDIVGLINIMRAVSDPLCNHVMGKILFHPAFAIPASDIFKVLSMSKKGDIIDTVSNAELAKSLNISKLGLEALARFGKLILDLSVFAKNNNCLETFRRIIDQSGIMKEVLGSDNSLERFSVIEALFSHIRGLSSNRHDYYLQDLIEYFDLVKNHKISISITAPRVNSAVRLMTAHRSKGLEFDHVIIAHAISGKWGNRRSRNKFNIPIIHGQADPESELNDERRLFYVAMTRARKTIDITYSNAGVDNKEFIPSQFLGELNSDLVKIIKHDQEDLELSDRSKNLLPTISAAQSTAITDLEYIKSRFLDQGLSVTNLNNYIECPWKYFFVNLIFLPELKTNAAMIGTAVHNSLKDFFDKYRIEEDMDKKSLLKLLEHYLSKEALPERDFTAACKKWKDNLGAYYDEYSGVGWPRNVINEYSISGVQLKLNSKDMQSELGTDHILLKGKLDKIEILDGGSKVNVIDYKTGSPKSRNDIMGKTKDASGNYYRQLIFYKLLLGLDERFNMENGVIDYVAPNASGKFKREAFVISDEEVEVLKGEIFRIAKEIITFEFKDRRCENVDCEYCELADLLAWHN